MHRNISRIIIFLVTILYQVAVFYSITTYATLFKFIKDAPLDEGHPSQPNRILTPFHMKNIIQFWIVSEITIYGASIICIVIILAMSSCYKLKVMRPIVSALEDD
jgi:hypothetical protein